ncbi:hypothetical protein [Nostoc sp. FACHB-110]|uniref:hypothetical protein n=1 Tax=Nostoc sp. FACHB-110 TaxID=2692834 RepID=UPI0016839966|nr:hypothetical protein [Nostoc sp. FACHB-110]MBD2437655.1 hypothetical protein [Nostoc sp. FACHB-110]
MVGTLVNLAGYCIRKELCNCSRNLIYREYRETDSLTVAIKLLRSLYPSLNKILLLCQQYIIGKNLNESVTQLPMYRISALSELLFALSKKTQLKLAAVLITGIIFVSRKGAKAQRARVLKVEFYDFIPHLCNAKLAIHRQIFQDFSTVKST